MCSHPKKRLVETVERRLSNLFTTTPGGRFVRPETSRGRSAQFSAAFKGPEGGSRASGKRPWKMLAIVGLVHGATLRAFSNRIPRRARASISGEVAPSYLHAPTWSGRSVSTRTTTTLPAATAGTTARACEESTLLPGRTPCAPGLARASLTSLAAPFPMGSGGGDPRQRPVPLGPPPRGAPDSTRTEARITPCGCIRTRCRTLARGTVSERTIP